MVPGCQSFPRTGKVLHPLTKRENLLQYKVANDLKLGCTPDIYKEVNEVLRKYS